MPVTPTPMLALVPGARPASRRARAPLAVLAILLAAPGFLAARAHAKASHAGWPPITGLLLMNKQDQSRPLDARPGHDPFDGADASYSCDGLHHSSACFPRWWWSAASAARSRRRAAPIVPASVGHNELLGGNGSDTIHAGPRGDVIWGDYKPSGQPASQVDHLYGGPGNDFIYASHGTSYIYTGGGRDVVHAHFGRGEIRCQSPSVIVHVSHRSRRGYRMFGCRHVRFD